MCVMCIKINKAYINRGVEAKGNKRAERKKTMHCFLSTCSHMTQVILVVTEFCVVPSYLYLRAKKGKGEEKKKEKETITRKNVYTTTETSKKHRQLQK